MDDDNLFMVEHFVVYQRTRAVARCLQIMSLMRRLRKELGQFEADKTFLELVKAEISRRQIIKGRTGAAGGSGSA